MNVAWGLVHAVRHISQWVILSLSNICVNQIQNRVNLAGQNE
jgi:hypothetical protein